MRIYSKESPQGNLRIPEDEADIRHLIDTGCTTGVEIGDHQDEDTHYHLNAVFVDCENYTVLYFPVNR